MLVLVVSAQHPWRRRWQLWQAARQCGEGASIHQWRHLLGPGCYHELLPQVCTAATAALQSSKIIIFKMLETGSLLKTRRNCAGQAAA
jgi:hypothetical protein